jgi:hypothetical protein
MCSVVRGGAGILIPYSGILTTDQLTGQVVQNDSAIGDPSLTFDINFFGAPAMTPEQFRSFVPVTYSGLHLTLGFGPVPEAPETGFRQY